MLATLLDVVRIAGPAVVAAIVAVLATREYMSRRGADGLIVDHDRRVRELNEELRSWIADRDRGARQTMVELRQQAGDRGIAEGDVLIQAAGRVYHQVLQEFRGALATQKRELDGLLASEGRAHQRRRERIGRPPGWITLTADATQTLQTWRERARYDPTALAVELWFAELEESVGVRRSDAPSAVGPGGPDPPAGR